MTVFPIDYQMILSLATAIIVSCILIPPVVKLSKEKHLVALPNGRTSHEGAIPTLGGIAIYASITIGAGLFMPRNLPSEFQYLMPALIILFFFGMQDDIGGIDPKKKLGGQIVSSLILIIAANVRMTTLHGLFGIYEIDFVPSVLMSLVIFIGLINAFNLIDGIDGLASGLGIVIALVFGIWLALLGAKHYAVLSFALAGSLIAFYRFNVFSKKFKLFMGDTGSMLIGFMFATLAIKVLCCPISPESELYMKAFPAVVMSLVIIPVSDTLRVMAIRMMKGRFPFFADRTHCHHDLLRLGLSHWQASTAIVTANIGLFMIALVLKDLPIFLVGVLMLSAGILLCNVPRMWLKYVLKRPDEIITHLHLSE
ncbi:MAG: MraY family glycosyltransferase [Bacteroidales bacterium]|jgi:UDP-N-acetylmuramyl pentapeptide phosphotransferase/UDP-N-acetylglucosamine-1-phosphate transferase